MLPLCVFKLTFVFCVVFFLHVCFLCSFFGSLVFLFSINEYGGNLEIKNDIIVCKY